MKRLARLTFAGILVAAAVPAWAGDVQVSFSNGLVTIVAIEATPRQVLMEWSRQGQVRITNMGQGAGRDPARPDPNRQPGPGRIVAPGVMPEAPAYYPGMPNPQSSATGASTPGVLTAPQRPLVVNPTANPNGLPNPVKPPTTTAPTGPIKRSGGDGQQE